MAIYQNLVLQGVLNYLEETAIIYGNILNIYFVFNPYLYWFIKGMNINELYS